MSAHAKSAAAAIGARKLDMYKKHDQRTHDIYSTTSDSQGALRSEEHAQPKLQKARHKT